jgi:hypothetical protein
MAENSSHHSTSQLVYEFRKLLQDYHNLDTGEIERFLEKHLGNKEFARHSTLLLNHYRARQELYD